MHGDASSSRVNDQDSSIDELLQLPVWDTNDTSHAWSGVPADLLGDISWWGRGEGQEPLLDANLIHLPVESGASQIGGTEARPTHIIERKRPRKESITTANDEESDAFESVSLPSEAIERAKEQLSICSWQEVNLSAASDLACNSLQCYAMNTMGPNPQDYFGAPLRMGRFEARIVEPVSGKDRHFWIDMPGPDSLIIRPPGKSLHLVFTQYPILAPPFSLTNGFALLTACRRKAGTASWEPQFFLSFEDPASKPKKLSGGQIGFVGNLDRCVGMQNGKRVWGQRTSHVQHADNRAKAVRIAPKGSTKSFAVEDSFCILISLHDANGLLMKDVNGEMCTARTNPFRFQEKKTESSLQHLLDQLDKLTISQRTSLANSAPNRDMTNLLLINSLETQEEAGLISGSRSEFLPSTACSLEDFAPDVGTELPSDYKARLQSAARLMGYIHANPDLTCKHANFLKSLNTVAARGRYMTLVDTNMHAHQDWLASHGITLQISAVSDRAQTLGTLMSDRKYKSHWIVCVMNVYPDSILADREDKDKIYCLAEEGRESPLELCDRLQPLARLAFTSKLTRGDLDEVLFAPYKAGFHSRHMGNEAAINLERFTLLLHAIYLDLFLYWTQFRNPTSCKRIQDRLLDQDQHFGESFFGPDRFKKFGV